MTRECGFKGCTEQLREFHHDEAFCFVHGTRNLNVPLPPPTMRQPVLVVNNCCDCSVPVTKTSTRCKSCNDVYLRNRPSSGRRGPGILLGKRSEPTRIYAEQPKRGRPKL